MDLVDIRTGILNCTSCKLCNSRQQAVPGHGAPDARFFVVGEAPGYWEEQKGQPFVGASGKFLMQLFNSIGITRQQLYIANTVNCRPPDNRDPMQDELDACRHWVFDQLEAVDPKVVITAGRYSLRMFFPSTSITDTHGKARFDGNRIYFASYHPAAALHNGSLKSIIEQDFLTLGDILKERNLI